MNPWFIIVLLSVGILASRATAEADVGAFGAKGDGITDDTPAIQKAVDAAQGSVRFGQGIYRVTQTIVVDLNRTGFTGLTADGSARVVMEGKGPTFKFVGTHVGTADPGRVQPGVWARERMPLIDGLEIVGAHPEADGIEATRVMQLTITRVTIREARHAIRLVDRNRNVIISDCHLYNNRGIGVYYDNVNLHQSNIVGCHISYNLGGGVVSRGGHVCNLQISGCAIEANMSATSQPTANVLLDSTGGLIAEVAITGCTIQHSRLAPHSANVRIQGRGDDGSARRPTNEGNVTITGNIFSDAWVNVHIDKARGVVLMGNTFWEAKEHDVLVEDSSNIVLGPNVFDRNPLYGGVHNADADVKGGLVFRNSRDCSLTGLHINSVRNKPAALHLVDCRRFNISNCAILDCDAIGLLMENVEHTRVAGCLISDQRDGATPSLSLRVVGGIGNWVTQNMLGNGHENRGAKFEGNYDAATEDDMGVVSRAKGAQPDHR